MRPPTSYHWSWPRLVWAWVGVELDIRPWTPLCNRQLRNGRYRGHRDFRLLRRTFEARYLKVWEDAVEIDDTALLPFQDL